LSNNEYVENNETLKEQEDIVQGSIKGKVLEPNTGKGSQYGLQRVRRTSQTGKTRWKWHTFHYFVGFVAFVGSSVRVLLCQTVVRTIRRQLLFLFLLVPFSYVLVNVRVKVKVSGVVSVIVVQKGEGLKEKVVVWCQWNTTSVVFY